jgi:Mrp family chromosome partitioning ATPase
MAVELKDIEAALDGVLLPQPKRSIRQLNMVRNIDATGGIVKLTLSLAPLGERERDSMEEVVRSTIEGIAGVDEVTIEIEDIPPQDMNEFNRVVAVMSGKGGVGKSLISSLLAIGLARDGQDVGILDADITGPSIPKMFGLNSRPLGSDNGILPVETSSGIEVMSLNLLLSHEDDAVIWRGPLLAKAITQFWQEVVWGKLDCLVVDLPPGTADIPLTVMQMLPLSGVVIVSTPQDLASMVVRKAVKMATKMEVPILGVVENMSYLIIPETGKKIEIFGRSRGEELAQAAESPLLGLLPVDPELAQLCDSGDIERYNSEPFESLASAFIQALQAAPPPVVKELGAMKKPGKAAS